MDTLKSILDKREDTASYWLMASDKLEELGYVNLAHQFKNHYYNNLNLLQNKLLFSSHVLNCGCLVYKLYDNSYLATIRFYYYDDFRIYYLSNNIVDIVEWIADNYPIWENWNGRDVLELAKRKSEYRYQYGNIMPIEKDQSLIDLIKKCHFDESYGSYFSETATEVLRCFIGLVYLLEEES